MEGVIKKAQLYHLWKMLAVQIKSKKKIQYNHNYYYY